MVYLTSNFIDICINTAVYASSIWVFRTNKVNAFTLFLGLMVVAVFSRILISYLNILNLIMFILKILEYIYARYVLSLLYAVLMVPDVM